MTHPAKTLAARLFDLIPPALPIEVIEEYGLTANVSQAQAITQEIILLSAYWIRYALRAGFPTPFGDMVEHQLVDHLQEHWESKFGLGEFSFEEFLETMRSRHKTWNQFTEQGAESIILCHQAIIELENQGALLDGKENSLLALLVDFVPVDELVEVVATIEEEAL